MSLFSAVSLTLAKQAELFYSTVTKVQQVSKTGYTHTFCLEQALEILKNDGLESFANTYSNYSNQLEQGITWADSTWKSSFHFYNPLTKKGWFGIPSAVEEGEAYWYKAISCWQKGNSDKTFFYLGACCHLIQDLCVPHHARGTIFSGHQEYESWAEGACYLFKESKFGEYGIGNTAGKWIHHNALISIDLFSQVNEEATKEDYIKATNMLLPLAQRTTAGFLASFMWEVGS